MVTGQPPKAIDAVWPYSSTANDTCHLWNAVIQCLLYSPGVVRGSRLEDDSCVLIRALSKAIKALALAAMEGCNRNMFAFVQSGGVLCERSPGCDEVGRVMREPYITS
jgi:hypothetical protein